MKTICETFVYRSLHSVAITINSINCLVVSIKDHLFVVANTIVKKKNCLFSFAHKTLYLLQNILKRSNLRQSSPLFYIWLLPSLPFLTISCFYVAVIRLSSLFYLTTMVVVNILAVIFFGRRSQFHYS